MVEATILEGWAGGMRYGVAEEEEPLIIWCRDHRGQVEGNIQTPRRNWKKRRIACREEL